MAKLTVNERGGGLTDRIVLDFAELQAIGNGGTRQIATIPAGGFVELAAVVNSVDIVGSSSLVIDVGTTLADPDEFINSLDVDAMTVLLPTINTGDQFTAGTTISTTGLTQGVKPVSSDTPVYIKVTDSAIASITAGEIVIGLRIVSTL
jgi:hypothetical protein